jgi:hypothetical protein
MWTNPVIIAQASTPEDVPPVISGNKQALLSIYRKRMYLLAVTVREGIGRFLYVKYGLWSYFLLVVTNVQP